MPKISETTSGVKDLVAGVENHRIVVTSLNVQIAAPDGAKNVKFQSHPPSGSATELTGPIMYQCVLPYYEQGYFETNVHESLKLNLSGSFVVGGHFTYRTKPHGA